MEKMPFIVSALVWTISGAVWADASQTVLDFNKNQAENLALSTKDPMMSVPNCLEKELKIPEAITEDKIKADVDVCMIRPEK